MAISSPENSCGERTSTSLWLLAPRASITSSRFARIASSSVLTVNFADLNPGTSCVVGRFSEIHFSRGPFISLTASWP